MQTRRVLMRSVERLARLGRLERLVGLLLTLRLVGLALVAWLRPRLISGRVC